MSVQLAEGSIQAKELLALKAGDVITLDTNPSDEALVMIEGSPKFYAYCGSYRGNRAARITRPIPKRDLINWKNKQELLKHGG
jgi:flagellar motor switch protein FliM